MSEITIKHTHEAGTLLYGSAPGDGVYELIGPRSAARFKYWPSIKMIGIPQSRDRLAKRWQIDTAAEILRNAGHTVTVEIDDTPRDVAEVKADRAGRLDARADRLSNRAERHSAEAIARFNRADQIAERFAGGQPILVGHHSERGARADQKRIDQAMRAGMAAQGKAEYAARAASVAGREEARRETAPVIIRRIKRLEAELRQTVHLIDGTRPANDWRGAYGDSWGLTRTPASGDHLERLTARRAFIEHQLEGERAALEAAKAAGYVQLSKETVHKGDVVTCWAGHVEVLRVNAKSVTVPSGYSWTHTIAYDKISRVECPHDGTTTVSKAPKPERPAREPRPAVTVPERPAPREAPPEVGASFEFFPTPPSVITLMLDAADMGEPGERRLTVLEPSAGNGAIASRAAGWGCLVDCIELNGQLAERLRNSCVARSVECADFREVPARPEYDRVLMNPPFGKQADIKHVTHALGFLKPGGVLVAVMSAGAEFREDRTATEFRALVAERGGRIERLPDDAFTVQNSGTNVRAVLAVIPAPAQPSPEAIQWAGDLNQRCQAAARERGRVGPAPEPELATLF